MKFCPYCGASLPGGAASFCTECGKPLQAKRTSGTQGRKKRQPQRQPRRRPVDPMDVNYDGYYNDIQPIDAGVRGEGMDPELVKRIGLVILCAVGAIILSVAFMMLL